LIDSLIEKRDLERSREVLVMWQLRQRSEYAYVSMAHILIYDNVLYPTLLTNIVITSPIYFISYCPLRQHICAFMHWEHGYHSMFPLYLLFVEARRGHNLGTELVAKGNLLSKRIL